MSLDPEFFEPCFDASGLIPAIAVSGRTGKVLMMAWMNRAALEKTLETGEVHYWSRSRGEIWHKGSTSGQTQKVQSIYIDCDQDCLMIEVEMPEPEIACHTGRVSCFFRRVERDSNGAVRLVDITD